MIPDPEGTLRRSVLKVEEADNLVVIKTPPGSAQPVAIVLESGNFDKVVGTLGGDDTCLVITRCKEDAVEVKNELMEIIR